MDSNLEIIKSLYENECQRIVECKDIKTGEIFIYNTIFNSKLIKLIDINILNSIKSNIVKCYKTQDRLYIVTKPHDVNNQVNLKEYIDTTNITLKKQFSISEQLINLFIDIYNVTDLLQYKILNFNNLSVDEDDNLIVNGYFEFKDEYDLSDNYSYKNVGTIIHYLFSKEEIVDYNISDNIPPDILKIIVKCLTREYFHPRDILKEFQNSPIYSIINCKTDTSSNRVKPSDLTVLAVNKNDNDSINKDKAVVNEDSVVTNEDVLNTNNTDLTEEACIDSLNEDEESNDNAFENDISSDIKNESESISDNVNIIDIYLNSVDEEKANSNALMDDTGKNKLSKAMKFLIPAFIIVFVTIVSIFLIKNLYNDEQADSGNVTTDKDSNKDDSKDSNTDITDNSENNTDDDSIKDDEKDQSQLDGEDSEFKLYLNDELIKHIGYTGKTAVIDTENYNEGTSSLLIQNDKDENVKVLFSVIDFSNEKLSYLKNNQVTISLKFKALKDVDAKLVVEAYMDDKLSANSSGKIEIFDDIWSQKVITITVGDIDRVNLYIEYSGINKVWIDTLDIDILK